MDRQRADEKRKEAKDQLRESGDPLVNIQKTMENCAFIYIYIYIDIDIDGLPSKNGDFL